MKKARSDATEEVAEPTVDLPVNPHPVLRYTSMRLAIFAVALGLLWLVRVRGLLLVALAVLISGLASYVLLQRERDAVSSRVVAATARRKVRSAALAAREDDIADELAQAEELSHVAETAPEESAATDLSAGPRS